MAAVDSDTIRNGLKEASARFFGGNFNETLQRQCTTGYGQKYCLVSKPKCHDLFELYMITANARNVNVIAKPMKISQAMNSDSLAALMVVVEQHYARNPLPDFTKPPVTCTIPTNYQLLSFTEVVLNGSDVESFLLPGDEVFLEFGLGENVIWHHAGIHVGGGWFCHFVPSGVVDSSQLYSANSFCAEIRCDTWHGFLHSFTNGPARRAFRVTHPLLVREGGVIVQHARRLMEEKAFSSYNFRFCNCQHFTSFCSYGVEFSYDCERLFMGGVGAVLEDGGTAQMPQSCYVNGVPVTVCDRKPPNSQYVASFDLPDSDYFSL